MYEQRHFKDGESSYLAPEWRRKLEKLEPVRRRPLKERARQSMRIKEDEVALKHPLTGAYVKLGDDGSIEMADGKGGGVRILNGEVHLMGNMLVVQAQESRRFVPAHREWVNGQGSSVHGWKDQGLTDEIVKMTEEEDA